MNEIFFLLFFSFYHLPFLRKRNKWQLILFEKTNCPLCSFIKSEFIRTEILFTNSPKKIFNNEKISFRIINCSRYENTCVSYGCYGVPTIILTDNKHKNVFRYTDENSALCERLTSFIIEKTKIQPKKKYYLEKFDEIFDNNTITFEDKYSRMLSLKDDLNIADFSYIHQYPDLINLNQIVLTDRCVALALPVQGKTPTFTRNIFDFFFKKEDFYPIVVKNKIGYQISESLSSVARIILFTVRGELVIFINNTLPNIINIINQFCFVNGYQQRRKFVEMLLFDDTQKSINNIKKSLLDQNIKANKDLTTRFTESDQMPSSSYQVKANITSSLNKSLDSNSSNSEISPECDDIVQSSDRSQSLEFTIPTQSANSEFAYPNSDFSAKFAGQIDYKLPYEFRYLAEEPEALILFAKTMYEANTVDRITHIIKQLRKTIIYDKIKRNIKEKLSQRIIILNIIRDILFSEFMEKYTGNR